MPTTSTLVLATGAVHYQVFNSAKIPGAVNVVLLNASNNPVGHVAFGYGPAWVTLHIVPGNGVDMWVRFGQVVSGTGFMIVEYAGGPWSDGMWGTTAINSYLSSLPTTYQSALQLAFQVGADVEDGDPGWPPPPPDSVAGVVCNANNILAAVMYTISMCAPASRTTTYGAAACGAGVGVILGCVIVPIAESLPSPFFVFPEDAAAWDSIQWNTNDSGDTDAAAPSEPGDYEPGTVSGGDGVCPDDE